MSLDEVEITTMEDVVYMGMKNEYSWFVEEVRKNQETMELISAVDKAIEEMPEDFEIKGFLQANRSEGKICALLNMTKPKQWDCSKRKGGKTI
ncbi:MAG: hypothetical protein K5696_01185 [Lachnospiraceae bacterium]|nr:hypothetical protein [Lachnospiraceae bacterium]